MNFKTNKITLALTFCSFLSAGGMASERTKEEQTNEIIGLSSGAVIGTVIAGPLGGLIASVFGVMIADDVNSDKRLEQVQQTLEQKDQQLLAMQNQFELAKERTMLQIASMDKALEQRVPEIESHIQFKTGSYVIEDHYKSQLDLIAKNLQRHPKLTITLSGFADQRGDSTFNQALSEQRALTVKSYLLDNGVNKEQVLTYSFGESDLVSAGAHFEDDFFDRRVMLKVSDTPSAMTAANQ